MRTQQIPGVVLVVVKDGEIATQRAYGVANIEFNVPMKVENVFTISSDEESRNHHDATWPTVLTHVDERLVAPAEPIAD